MTKTESPTEFSIGRILQYDHWTGLFTRGYRLLSSPIRVRPDFLIIGGMKCGTTSLHRYLSRHPQIHDAFQKEVHYYDLTHNRGELYYRAHFPTILSQLYIRRKLHQHVLAFESTPDYLFYPMAAERISNDLPDVKLLVLLRDPVSRAWSHYHHEQRMGYENHSFREALRMEEDRLEGEEELIRNNPSYFSRHYYSHSYRERGKYVESLTPYFTLFDHDQIFIAESEQFFDNPESVISEVYSFLDISDWMPDEFGVHNPGEYESMDDDIRAELQSFYQPYNRKLQSLTGQSFSWANNHHE